MPTRAPARTTTRSKKLRELKRLLGLSETELLSLAKAELATALAVEVSRKKYALDKFSELLNVLLSIGFFREKAAKAAGKQLAKLMLAMGGNGRGNLCIDYCKRRKSLRETIKKIRSAVTVAEVADDLAGIADFLATIIEFIHAIKLPVSVALFALLYAFDELCGCDKFDPKRPRNFNLQG